MKIPSFGVSIARAIMIAWLNPETRLEAEQALRELFAPNLNQPKKTSDEKETPTSSKESKP